MKANLTVHWFEKWHPDLDAALLLLPEKKSCPHELFKQLVQNDSVPGKRTALVTKDDAPVAVVGLRKRVDNWVPVTHYLLPGFFFPMQEACLGSILESLNVNLWMSWWRNNIPVPQSRYIINIEKIPTYMLGLTQDYEQTWTKKHFKNVRSARKHCQDFTFAVNPPGSAEWVVENSYMKWEENADAQDVEQSDEQIIINYLEKMNRHYSLILMDKGEFIAGSNLIVHGSDLVGVKTFRRAEYDNFSIGTYIMDLTFSWAKDAGFHNVDMGGDYADYKKRWAQCKGEKINIHICPPHKFFINKIKHSFNRVP
ncbi:GNAT family N-acetyltransferase [candidate division KSB1 bacterium]|nr:GNAT family N-acetyltransferase [candidate division KSB1 bacterium]